MSNYGFVYFSYLPNKPGYVKIGMTSGEALSDDVVARRAIHGLNNDAHYGRYCDEEGWALGGWVAYETRDAARKVERAAHRAFENAGLRVRTTEIVKASPADAARVVRGMKSSARIGARWPRPTAHRTVEHPGIPARSRADTGSWLVEHAGELGIALVVLMALAFLAAFPFVLFIPVGAALAHMVMNRL